MHRVTFKCDRPNCGGPVWSDIESHKYIDMSCLYCGKRWFIKKAIYKALLEKLEKKYASRRAAARKLLEAS